jgi:hypothetical protein
MHRCLALLSSLFAALGVLLSPVAAYAQEPRAWSPETPGCRFSSECNDPGVTPPKDPRCFVGTCTVPTGDCQYSVQIGLNLGYNTVRYQCVDVPEQCNSEGVPVENPAGGVFKSGAQCDPQLGFGLAPSRGLPRTFTDRYDIHGRPPTYICDLYTCLVRYCGDGIIQNVAPLNEECDGSARAGGVSSDATCTQRTCKAMTLTFDPASITYGDALGASQLNAVASVQGGTISYASTTIRPYQLGSLPSAGRHPVTATWSPATAEAQALYDSTSRDGILVVNPKAASCTAGTYEKMESDPTPALSFSCEGILARDSVGGRVGLEPGATPNKAGSYKIVFTQRPSDPNYTITLAEGELTVKAAAVAGGCGTAAKKYSSDNSAFQGSLCATGSASPAAPEFPAQGGNTTWSCSGANGGASASCSASREAAAVDGVCGDAAKKYLATDEAFVPDFCRLGLAQPQSPAFPLSGKEVSWTCKGANGGIDITCTAKRDMPVAVVPAPPPAAPAPSGGSRDGPSIVPGGASGGSGSSGKLTRDEFCAAVARCPVQHTNCKDPFAPICPKCADVTGDVQCDPNPPPAISRITNGGPMKVKAILDDKLTLDRSDDEWNCKCVCTYGESDHAVGCGAQPKEDRCAGFNVTAGGCSTDPVPWSCLNTDSCRSEIVPWLNPQAGQGGQSDGQGNGQGTNNPRECCKELVGR